MRTERHPLWRRIARRVWRKNGLVRDTRGAAFTETLITAPAFIALFSAMVFFQAYYAGQVDDRRLIRGCAWMYSVLGCKEYPESCIGIAAAAAGTPASETALGSEGQEIKGDVADLNSNMQVPFLDNIMETILGETMSATKTTKIGMPGWVGGGERSADQTINLACNAVPKTLMDILKDIFCAVAGIALGGLVDTIC